MILESHTSYLAAELGSLQNLPPCKRVSLPSFKVPGLVPVKQTLTCTIVLPYLSRVLAPAKKELLLIVYLSQGSCYLPMLYPVQTL